MTVGRGGEPGAAVFGPDLQGAPVYCKFTISALLYEHKFVLAAFRSFFSNMHTLRRLVFVSCAGPILILPQEEFYLDSNQNADVQKAPLMCI